ncbi:LysM peptidoglycan-binding domain-containing protein [Ilumatobacter sp.]|uniref:LysM peptidoglycan-binding domain-containing protein n=1 Tax=Ilumatobacter sp. TaxID=1967498 RepID=UPI00375011F8
MSTGNDDFWGNQSDWSDRPNRQPTNRAPRVDASIDQSAVPLNVGAERAGQRIKRRWANLLSSGTNPTREHGIVRPEAARPEPARPVEPAEGMFDDLDDFDYFDDASGDTAVATPTPRTDPVAAATPQDWDAEFAPAPVATDHTQSPGVDPLLMRLGVVALVAALLVPVLSSFRGNSAASLIESSSSSELAATFNLLPADAAATGVPTSAAAGQLDPNDLPPAVPVNTQPVAVAEAAAPNTEPVAVARLADPGTTPTNGNAALGAATVAAPAERVERNCAIDYEVVAGDFWIRLASAADVPIAELLEANGATSLTPIYPGTSICLPAGAATPAPPTTTAPPVTTTPTMPATTTPTTPPATTPATTPVGTTPSSTNSTPDEVEQIIRDVWPDELEERALEIAYRESKFVPTAKNSCCYGLFQIYWKVHQSWLDDIGITDRQQLYDPVTNARAAYTLYQRAGGWGPWSF